MSRLFLLSLFLVMGKIMSFFRFRSGRPYITVAIMTRKAPTQNRNVGRKSNKTAEIIHDTMILIDVAKTFMTLSAYFTTTATIKPPMACTATTPHTIGEYPTKKPFSATIAESST